MDTPRRPRPPIQTLKLRYLLAPPILLAAGTITLLLLPSSSINIPLLWSQCHARSRLPSLSHTPFLGTPTCFLVSFLRESLASSRSLAIMASALSFIASLMTITTLESARLCNRPAPLIAHPTPLWLLFNLLPGGALVLQLVVLPSFLVRGRQILLARREGESGGGMVSATHPDHGSAMRHLASAAEAVAIPLAVAVGYVVPSVVMLLLDAPVAIGVWLFSPLWVSLIRQAVRAGVLRMKKRDELFAQSLHLEASRAWLAATYAVPVLCSVLAHGLLIFSLLARRDDGKEMTRATIKFVEIDVWFVGLTVLYWLFVEAGWQVALVMVLASVVLGPGAGVCLAWIYREGKVDPDRSVTVVAVVARNEAGPSEDTPLLR